MSQQRRAPVRRPPRRLPARVYWFRRALVLGVLVLLVWGVASGVGRLTGDDTQPTAGSAPAEPTTTSTEPTTEPGRDSPRRPRGDRPGRPADEEPRVVDASLPSAEGGCLAEDVAVVPTPPEEAVSGQDVRLDLALSTTGDDACRLELDAEVLLVSVSTDGSSVWSTEQCPGAVPEQTVVLRPGWVSALAISWPGLVGDRQCSGTTRPGPPGAYAVEAALYGSEPGRADFDLLPPVDAAPDDEPEDEPTEDEPTEDEPQT